MGSSDEGQGPGGETKSPASSQDAKLKKDLEVLRGMEAQILEMGQSYPTATKALRTASESIRAAQRQIVSSPGLAEPPKPNTYA